MSDAGAQSPETVLGLEPGSRLAAFNRAGILGSADVHVARRLARLAGETDERVVLAVALAVRAPRFGHVLVDLSTVETSLAGAEEGDQVVDLEALPWPDAGAWAQAVVASPAVAVGDEAPAPRPLRLVGPALYLARHWHEEVTVASALLSRAAEAGAEGPAGEGDEQARAVALSLSGRLAVIAGGPGTGKTTTIARSLALVFQGPEPAGRRPLVALAAPTGKAAARMTEAVHRQAMSLDVPVEVRHQLLSLEASTVHRLLGRHPGSSTRFRHDRFNRLPHDVVVVDETSMMSLSLMASLVEAVRPQARLVLLGDPQQLASVEAGAVLGDIVGPVLAAPAGAPADRAERPALERCIALLRTNHRFSGPLAQLAEAVREGDADTVVAVLNGAGPGRGGPGPLLWIKEDAAAGAPAPGPVRAMVLEAAQRVVVAASAGDGQGALREAGGLRVLCAHRDGPAGASTWNNLVERWLGEQGLAPAPGLASPGPWYPGRPVLVTANDYSIGLFNGDLGVAVARPGGGLGVVFEGACGLRAFSPSRLTAWATAYAMTAHRAQGSEFDQVVVVLPAARSRVLTRELLYTAVTRARRSLLVVGPEETIRAAVARPVARASGLAARLWQAPG